MKENRRYILDTNVLIEIIHGNRTVINHVLTVGTKACAVIVDKFDMVIAGQALYNDMIVVTNNLKHFKGIDNLLVEDWSR